jgi:hypothetical protein
MRLFVPIVCCALIFAPEVRAERDQVAFDFDYNEPGRYQILVTPGADKVMCWITFNEISGFPRSRSSKGNWQYYRVVSKHSDYSGVVEVDVPCPNGSISLGDLFEFSRKKVSDDKGDYIELVQKHLRGCLGGRASREGNWVVVQADSKSQCLSGKEMDSWGHGVGFERW